MDADYYELLGVPQFRGIVTDRMHETFVTMVRENFREIIAGRHPDHGGSHEAALDIGRLQEAKDVLCSKDRRKAYDQRKISFSSPGSPSPNRPSSPASTRPPSTSNANRRSNQEPRRRPSSAPERPGGFTITSEDQREILYTVHFNTETGCKTIDRVYRDGYVTRFPKLVDMILEGSDIADNFGHRAILKVFSEHIDFTQVGPGLENLISRLDFDGDEGDSFDVVYAMLTQKRLPEKYLLMIINKLDITNVQHLDTIFEILMSRSFGFDYKALHDKWFANDMNAKAMFIQEILWVRSSERLFSPRDLVERLQMGYHEKSINLRGRSSKALTSYLDEIHERVEDRIRRKIERLNLDPDAFVERWLAAKPEIIANFYENLSNVFRAYSIFTKSRGCKANFDFISGNEFIDYYLDEYFRMQKDIFLLYPLDKEQALFLPKSLLIKFTSEYLEFFFEDYKNTEFFTRGYVKNLLLRAVDVQTTYVSSETAFNSLRSRHPGIPLTIIRNVSLNNVAAESKLRRILLFAEEIHTHCHFAERLSLWLAFRNVGLFRKSPNLWVPKIYEDAAKYKLALQGRFGKSLDETDDTDRDLHERIEGRDYGYDHVQRVKAANELNEIFSKGNLAPDVQEALLLYFEGNKEEAADTLRVDMSQLDDQINVIISDLRSVALDGPEIGIE